MRIAIIGAGFAGLSVARHLIPRHSITLFDSAGPGSSGIAAGLMHPYVGEQGRRSAHATEALESSMGLIQEVERDLGVQLAVPGLVRHLGNEEQRVQFALHAMKQGDVSFLDENRIEIHTGWTVDCPRYLGGLEKLLMREGVECIHTQVDDLTALDAFDQIIVCAGAGVRSLLPEAPLRISLIKGQLLVCKASSLPKMSLLGKGYLALAREPGLCYLGSTYEKNFISQAPDSAVARAEILPKIERLYPPAADFEVVDCRAAVRVTPQGHYFPILAKVQDRVWVVTGLGSRGLLYHGLLGKLMNEKL